MTVPSPGVVFHLCLIVLACTHVSGGEVPDTLNGLINQSILMSLANDSSPSVQQLIWNFGRIPLLTYSNNQITYIEDSFEGRLKILNDGRSLKIGNLRLEDSALYTGTITFTDKTKDQKTYNLTVYEPVPTPSIKTAEKKTDDWCNATLYCSAPKNKSSLSYTWNYKMYRNSTYQQYNSSGDTIEITLQKGSWAMEFMCIVQNPADWKNVSVQNICQYNDRSHESAPNGTRTYGLLGLVLIIPLAFLGWYFIMKRKRRKAGTPDVTENKNGEPQYIQVTTIQPNADREEWNNSLYDSSPRQKPKAVTVYATLEHPPETKR